MNLNCGLALHKAQASKAAWRPQALLSSDTCQHMACD